MQSQPSGHKEISLLSQTDAELFLVSRTNKTAFSILYDRHAGLVYGIALKVLGNSQEAEDLTQDVFLSLVRGCSYDPNRGSLRTFLAVLTRSRAIDRVRSRHTKLEVLHRWRSNRADAATLDPPLEHLFQTEQSEAVQAALAQLSEGEQLILKLAYYGGLSQSEIALRLHLPLGTVKARARRGLLKLREILTITR